MATTTAIPTLKLASTADITLLLPADIAKLTEVDFAAFTTQQQVDLSPAQIAPLTAKQLAALPFKFVEPGTVAGITPKILSALDLKSLSADQFSYLTTEQIKALTPAQITALTTAQVDVLQPEQTAVLSSTQVAAFTSASIKFLSEFALETISKDGILGLTPANIIGLTTDSIKILTTEQVGALKFDQINALTPTLVTAMEAEDLAVLTIDAIKGFTIKAIPSLDLTALSSEQLSAFTPKQMAAFTASQLALLDENYSSVFTAKVLAVLDTKQIDAISTSIITALDPLAVKGFTVQNIKGLNATQLAVITPEQGVNLSKAQLGSLSAAKVSALSSDVIVQLTPQVLKSLPVSIVSNLSPAAFSAFSDLQIAGFSSTQIAGLTTAQAAGLTSAHIQKFTAVAFKNLSANAIAALSADALSGLTTKQITGLSVTQLEKMTPAQVAQFPQEITDWAVNTKRYTTIQSAETDSNVQSGIKTSNTITGTARAETINSSAGADTITSTNSTAADSISSGAGNDSITVSKPATGNHVINAGSGTDTITFNDTNPTLTSVTGVEVVVLANTASQSFNAGSGTDNALTSLNATAIADNSTLTLTGSVANLPISLTDGNLTASAYTAKLVVTATGTNAKTIVTGSGNDSITTGNGANSVEGGTGNDTIVAGTGNDTIKGQAGVDSVTGGTGDDTFSFVAADNGAAPSATVFDTIVDFGTGSDIIDFDATVTIATNSATATTSAARISQAGKAFFDPATTSLADKITAVKGGILASSQADGEAAVFTHGSDSYIFIAAGAAASSSDILIKLEGKASVTNGLVLNTDGNISSISGIAATGNAASFSGTGLYVMDTANNIQTKLADSTSGLIDAITNGKIANITASDDAPIVLTSAAFAQVLGTSSTKVADLLDTGSVNISGAMPVNSGGTAAAYATQKAALLATTSITKIADDGILATTTGLTLTPAEFNTLDAKLFQHASTATSSTKVTIDANGSPSTTDLANISTNIQNVVDTSGITNLSLDVSDAAIIDTVTANLLSKATNASVTATSATATELASMITYKANIAAGSSTAGISGTVPAMTATQFKDLGSKLQDSVTTVSFVITATEAVDSTIMSAIAADIGNINNTGISAASALTLALTAEQFGNLSAKLGNNITATVDATNATTSQLAAVSTDIGGGSTKVASVTNLTATLANLDNTQTTNLLSKAVNANVVATDASTTEIGHLVTRVANIASTGITGTIPLTATQFAAVHSKLNNSANVTVTLASSDAGSTPLDNVIDNIGKVDTLAGSVQVTAAQFVKTGFAAKLSSSSIAVTINASGATNAQLKTISDTITSTPNVVTSISALTLDLSVDYAGGGHTSAGNDTVTTNLLSKATGATVYANNSETASELAALTTYAANISTVSNTNNTVTAADFAANYANLPTGVVVDAANASADNLRVVIAQDAKVGSIKNLAVNNQVHSAADVLKLLAKAQNGSATATATWADSATIGHLVTYVHKLKDGSVSGAGMAMTADQFGTLGAKIASTVTDMTIDASGATSVQLASVSSYAPRVGLINNLTINLGDAQITNEVTANLISRAALASAAVVATGATATELNSVAASIGNVTASTGITGVIAIDSNVSASNITALFGKTTTTTGTVNVSNMSAAQITAVDGVDAKLAALGVTGSVTGMNSTQLNALAIIDATKIGDLTGVLALNSDVLAANITALHTKYVGTDATVSITGMDNTQIGNLVNADIATGGITGNVNGLNAAALNALALKATDIAANTLTGTLALTSSVGVASGSNTVADITTLFDKYAGTTATVDASSMTNSQLALVAGGASKITGSGISNLSSAAASFTLGATGITGTVVNSLLSKSAGGVTLNITGATSDDLDALVTNVGKIAAGGAATGLTTTTTTDVFTDTQFTALYGKLATGETVYVDAEGASTAELTAIAANIGKVTTLGLTNLTVTSTQPTADITALLGKAPVSSTTAGAKVSAGSMTSAQLGAVGASGAIANVMAAGITGVMNVKADVDGATHDGVMIGALFTKYSGTTAIADITGMDEHEIGALVNDKISTGGITGSLQGLATADTTALVAKISDIADGTSTTGLTTGTGFTVLNSNFATLVPKLQTTYNPNTITVDFNDAAPGSVTFTAAQNNGVIILTGGADAGSQTVRISDASTSLTSNTNIEAYVLEGAGANTITLTVGSVANTSSQTVTTAVHASNQTVSTGLATIFTGTITGNSTATDILNIATTATAINGATTTTVDQITLANNVNATMTIAQNALVTTATGTNIVTLSANGTATGAAQVESYVLATGANTFTLGAAAQNVTFQTGNADTLNVGGYTVTGTFNGIEAADNIVMTTGANVAAMAGAAALANITGSVTMTNAQAVAFTTVTANGTSDQITLTTAASALALNAAIETYVFSNNANTATLGTAAGNLAQNVTGGSSTDVLTLGAGAYTGTWTGGISGLSLVTGNTSIAGVNGGSAITTSPTLLITGGGNVTMTAAQYQGLGAITAAGTDTVTLTTALSGSVTGDVAIENYVLGGSTTNSFTLGAAAQTVTGSTGADTIITGAIAPTGNTVLLGLTSVDSITLATGNDIAVAKFGAAGTAGVAGAATGAGTAVIVGSVTMTTAQHSGFATAITAAGGTDQITLTTVASGVTLDADVETYVLGNFVNSVTLGAAAQNVTGVAGNDTVKTGALTTVSGTLTGSTGTNTLQIEDNATFSGTLTDTWVISVDTAKTLTTTAAKATGKTISGTGSVAVTALQSTLTADLSNISSSGGITAAVTTTGGVTLSTANLGSAVVNATGTGILNVDAATLGTATFTVGTGSTLQGTAANLTGKTASGLGTVQVTALDATATANLSAITATTVGVTVTAATDITANANSFASVDSYTLSATATLTVLPTQVSGQTLAVTGTSATTDLLIVAGTGGVDTINLGNVTFTNAGTSITGGVGADVITLHATGGADIVVLSSTDTAADTVNNFHVAALADKIKIDAVASGTGITAGGLTSSVNLNGGGGAAAAISKGMTTISDNATTLDAAGIYAALTGGANDLTVANADNVVYIAIDNGTNTAIARINAATDTVIDQSEITVVGILNNVTDATSLIAANFVSFA